MGNRLHLTNTTLVITLKCNLKCKLCAVSAPYYTDINHYELDDLVATITKYFETVDFVDKFTINGGEPFIHPNLNEIMQEAIKHIEKVGILEIITNGTIVPNNQLLMTLKSSPKIDILVDNYGNALSKKVNEIISLFDDNEIKYRHRKYYGDDAHFGGWVNLHNVKYKNRTDEETAELYSKCAYPGPFNSFAIFKNEAYICGVYLRTKTKNIIEDDPSEYVDFSDNTLTRNELRKKIRDFHNRKFVSSCRYCDGFCNDSKRYTPAEQL